MSEETPESNPEVQNAAQTSVLRSRMEMFQRQQINRLARAPRTLPWLKIAVVIVCLTIFAVGFRYVLF